ncbi:MAG: hypothetical protein ACPL68_05640, partial [Candidatus Hydrothermia bacterium]
LMVVGEPGIGKTLFLYLVRGNYTPPGCAGNLSIIGNLSQDETFELVDKALAESILQKNQEGIQRQFVVMLRRHAQLRSRYRVEGDGVLDFVDFVNRLTGTDEVKGSWTFSGSSSSRTDTAGRYKQTPTGKFWTLWHLYWMTRSMRETSGKN